MTIKVLEFKTICLIDKTLWQFGCVVRNTPLPPLVGRSFPQRLRL